MAINYEALSLIHPDLGTSVGGFLPDTAHVFRKTTAAAAPVSNLSFGYDNGGNAPAPVTLSDGEEIADYRCAITEFRNSDGKQTVVVDKVEVVVPWRISFGRAATAINVGDLLEIGARRFKVIIPPRSSSFAVLSGALCQEIL